MEASHIHLLAMGSFAFIYESRSAEREHPFMFGSILSSSFCSPLQREEKEEANIVPEGSDLPRARGEGPSGSTL